MWSPPVPVDQASTCDCVTQALWQRNLAWRHPEIKEDDLMMISESDVLITTGKILQPLQGDFRSIHYFQHLLLVSLLHLAIWVFIFISFCTAKAARNKAVVILVLKCKLLEILTDLNYIFSGLGYSGPRQPCTGARPSPWPSPPWPSGTGGWSSRTARAARRPSTSSPSTPRWRPSGTGPRSSTARTGSPTRTSSRPSW